MVTEGSNWSGRERERREVVLGAKEPPSGKRVAEMACVTLFTSLPQKRKEASESEK